jgi:ribosome-associated toxin RatA of RatAB toxin-antitoxin module
MDSDATPILDEDISDGSSSMVQGVTLSTERLEHRHRKISASIWIPQSVEQLWNILTDYNHLADFIPNLESSRCLDTTEGDRIRIEQIGAECLFNLKFCARVVLDMLETFPHRIDFTMVEGDFRSFEGNWQLHPEMDEEGRPGTRLEYTVVIQPTHLMPIGLIERHLGKNLTMNLLAIRQHAQDLFPA